ncbi:acyltransferase domain-containing protein [Aetokthonos hydrillicola Thurmond2011]|jgi:acyl transferase domain-containing protein|uniref:Acyltransferase domain-containing protein n=3 Tax=Aetokthonos TaxID=1550243 RepID=A0AAP5MB12_9CYAN|nr:polyketide synthase [Aetokthonos hydrillicola]MBW4586294.1 acyltransferase domain-containing protein [Aetokthonos hydrillicola CCALA 1050]MDR9897422.1 acyltransferase domain-containing protein [Aetokthonos hydrillicola Thurmond2011]
MSAYSIDTALAQLEDQINDCEKAVVRFIEEKKKMSDKSLSFNKINRQLQHNPIAIIGMASLFAKARNLQEYWQNILNKTDCITDVPSSHWNIDDYYDPNPRTPEEKTYCKRGGFVPHVDFNPMEFGIPPNILEVTDVSQLLSLVVAKEAMEDAGYGLSRDFNRETVGVILGVAMAKQLGMPLAARLEYPVWEKVLKSSGLSDEDTQKIVKKIKSAYVNWDENAFPGMLANIVAGRIANRLNFGGINCVIDAACASSFGALKMAISELVEHRCDMMLTGGVDTDNTIMGYMCFSKTPAVSPSENVKPFDAKSDGMMLGEGVGMIVLKRLEDAVRDNDKIYAVIKGIGTSSDGRYKSIYAPRLEGQVKALERAYEDAGIPPTTVGLMEAHGTGTMAGDPTEFGSLREFFGEPDSRRQYIALGTVKSQIGHTKAAAGAASLIKTALALHHKILPATINVTEPNPKLNIKNSRFYLNTETRPWIRSEAEPPRRAGISSFGFGGTNYHIVLEEYEAEHHRPYRIHNTASELLLAANNPAQLLSHCEEVLGKLQSGAGEKHYLELIDECKSKEVPLVAARVGFVASSRSEACKLLQICIDLLKNKPSTESWEHPQGIYYRQTGLDLAGKVVSLFSGQGSQYLDMGRELVMNFPTLRNLYGCMDNLFLKDNLQPLSEIVFPHPVFDEAEKNSQVAALQRTEYAQPAIGMLSAGLYKILQQAGFKSDFVAGHSFGELTALWAAGVLSEEDYCFLVKARGQAMAAPQDPDYDPGTMLAVKEEIAKVEAIIRHFPQVTIANLNSPRQVVLAGPVTEIAKARQALQEKGCTTVSLPVSAAFHTPLIAFAQKAFAQAIKTVTFSNPKLPVYTNVTGKPYPQESAAIQKILETHLNNSVLFKQEIENIYAAGGYCFVEFGPRRILANLVKEILGDRPHMTIALNPSSQKNSDRSLREAVVQLRVAGLNLKNLDPYQLPKPVATTEKNSPLNVRLNGINYVSDKTKKAFEQALQDGHQVTLNSSKSLENTISLDLKEYDQETGRVTSLLGGDEDERGGGRVTSLLGGDEDERGGGRVNSLLGGDEDERGGGRVNSLLGGDEDERGGGRVNSSTPTPQSLIPNTQSPIPSPQSPIPNTQSPVPNPQMQATPENYHRVLESLENVLEQFQQNQSENLQVHGHYLNHQMEYAKTFFQLMQQQNSLFANCESSTEAAQIKPVVLESLNRSMEQFHTQQGETLRIHEQYLQHQVELTKNFFQLLQQEYSQLVTGEKSAKVTALLTSEAPTLPYSTENGNTTSAQVFTSVVTQQVTVPEVINNSYSTVSQPTVNQNAIAQSAGAKAIAQVAEETTQQAFTSQPIAKTIEPETVVSETFPEPVLETVAVKTEPEVIVTPVSSGTINLADLGKNLLAITSEKTGYPVEMLDLDMDMEADLGIDSIKRVEILGAIQEMYPDLPKPNVEELGELRTIGQTVEYLQSQVAKSMSVESTVSTPEPQIENHTVAADVESKVMDFVKDLAQASSVDFTDKPSVVASASFEPITDDSPATNDLTDLGQTLLAITSEKTGYPVEMLDLDMDMEADLGIDSIKRVEILGAMQEIYPDLPKPNVEELGELRTIGQIVQYLQKLVGGEKKKPQQPSCDQPIQLNNNTLRRQVKLKTLPQPDFLDFTLPEGYIGLVTDDGTLTTSKLAKSLIDKGWKVVVLSFPQSLIPQQAPLPAGVSRVTLCELSEEHLQQQLSAIATTYGSIGAFIHLNPVFGVSHNGKIPYLEEEKLIVKHVFFIAKHLKQSLNQAARLGRSCFCTVVRLDGAFGLGRYVNFGPISAGLFGLTKTLNWEWQQVFCRAIDLNPTINADESAQNIVAELHDPNRHLTEVAYGSQGRVTLISALK